MAGAERLPKRSAGAVELQTHCERQDTAENSQRTE